MGKQEMGCKVPKPEELTVTEAEASVPEARPCGIIMPISEIDGCPPTHWEAVQHILTQAIESAGFKASLVSDSDETGVIHKRIVQNLYNNPIVVCDISARNPNVMFELGMRLAFDKPTVIVKDDCTPSSFDTSVIEYLSYPRSLRFPDIVDFKERLKSKVVATAARAEDYSFLRSFGHFEVQQLETKEVGPWEYVLEELKIIKESLPSTRSYSDDVLARGGIHRETTFNFCLGNVTSARAKQMVAFIISKTPSIVGFELLSSDHDSMPEKHLHVRVHVNQSSMPRDFSKTVIGLIEEYRLAQIPGQ